MSHPGVHAAARPDHPAVIMEPSGRVVTYAELDDRAARLARAWHDAGLRRGDHVAVFSDNHPEVFEAYWAAVRSGLYLTAVNRYLSADEAAYVLDDCGARAVVGSAALAEVAAALPARAPRVELWSAFGGPIEGFVDHAELVAAASPEPLEERRRGDVMLYSSGTTGRPKGIERPLGEATYDELSPHLAGVVAMGGLGPDSVYLSPAPLYHSAPLTYCAGVHATGGTTVVMGHFDAESALRLIERHRVDVAQWVPTMFVRMLKLPEAVRSSIDVSSLRLAVHAAAPCPVEVKRRMIEWWGPILLEYYAGTEGNGSTLITSEEWLAHPGSVGRAMTGVIHICDDDGRELPTGEAGLVYFEAPDRPFSYHGDPDTTRRAQHPVHPNWTALGDVGHVDDEGYLYLTDRKAFMIISGGVNIYPQEIEDCLVMHPSVGDVAVFGLPDPEMGEFVQAVVEPAAGADRDALPDELRTWARERIAHYKVPRHIDVVDELPRLPTGKLYKRGLRDRYLDLLVGSGRVRGSPRGTGPGPRPSRG